MKRIIIICAISLLFNSCLQGGGYFGKYKCTDDCSGHKAGYNWSKKKGIKNINDCGGNSQSFIEGCMHYVESNF